MAECEGALCKWTNVMRGTCPKCPLICHILTRPGTVCPIFTLFALIWRFTAPGWAWRWFVLSDNVLTYYTTKVNTKNSKLGSLTLTDKKIIGQTCKRRETGIDTGTRGIPVNWGRHKLLADRWRSHLPLPGQCFTRCLKTTLRFYILMIQWQPSFDLFF